MAKARTLGAVLAMLGIPLALGLLAPACESHDHGGGTPTKAVCPQQQTLTYDNFGKDFFQRYCLRCHSSGVVGAARNAAPADHNFDTRAEIRGFADHIDEYAAAGPSAANVKMPPTAPLPTEEERRKLGGWLACGAP